MKIVIDISEKIYDTIMSDEMPTRDQMSAIVTRIYQGIPLPKGHGRLIDADKTLEVAWQEFYRHEEEWGEKDEDYLPLHRFYDQNGFECCHQTIVNAPTIIEAESESEG